MAIWWILEPVPFAVTAMLPVSTPPNAIVFSTGRVKIADMCKAGIVMNVIGMILVILTMLYLFPLAMGWKGR